jgi:hypothetical protein
MLPRMLLRELHGVLLKALLVRVGNILLMPSLLWGQILKLLVTVPPQ